MGGKGKGKEKRKQHEGEPGGCNHDHDGAANGKTGKRKSRNAYEAVPKKGKAASVEVIS